MTYCVTITSHCHFSLQSIANLKIGNDCLQKRGEKRWPKEVDWPKREAGRIGVCGAELSLQSLDKANVSVICFRVQQHSETDNVDKTVPPLQMSANLLFPPPFSQSSNQHYWHWSVIDGETTSTTIDSFFSAVRREKSTVAEKEHSATNDHKQQKGAKFSAKTTHRTKNSDTFKSPLSWAPQLKLAVSTVELANWIELNWTELEWAIGTMRRASKLVSTKWRYKTAALLWTSETTTFVCSVVIIQTVWQTEQNRKKRQEQLIEWKTK